MDIRPQLRLAEERERHDDFLEDDRLLRSLLPKELNLLLKDPPEHQQVADEVVAIVLLRWTEEPRSC